MPEAALHYCSLLEISHRIRGGNLSPIALTEVMLERIASHDGMICSYITVTAHHARARARRAADEIARGFWRGPLHGVPIALKDLCDTDFAPTTGGMAFRTDFVPRENATVVDRLEAAGAVILGKLAMTEGAYAFHHPALPTPRNPWHADRWPGASSSGSGAATAAGLCFASLGSDTAGSIRLPSSACGLTGVKPTWGRVSRHGIVHLAETMDHIGPMARTAADAAAVLQVIAGSDPRDATALPAPVPDYLGGIGGGLSEVRIGFDSAILESVASEVAEVVVQAADALRRGGARILPVAMPASETMLAGWPALCAAEARRAHDATWPERRADYGEALAALLEQGESVIAADLVATQIELRLYAGRLAGLFSMVDLLLLPVVPFTMPALENVAAVMAEGVPSISRFTAPFDMTGHPTITLSGGVDRDGVPIGFQLVARSFEEALLLRAGHAYQRLTDWHTRHPI